jgi:3-dehydroquinate dehydratase-2
MKIAIINGPNLNLTGVREKEIYGTHTFESFIESMQQNYPGLELHYFHSNIEGEIISEIQRVGFEYHGIILNPGGYTHTSVAIGDAVAAIPAKVIEVHLSNIFDREDFRKLSYVSSRCMGTITGLGMRGYEMAIQYFIF